jgi:hypothetical protein
VEDEPSQNPEFLKENELLNKHYADVELTLFGQTKTLAEFEKDCPVPLDNVSPDKLNDMTVKMMNAGGAAIEPRHEATFVQTLEKLGIKPTFKVRITTEAVVEPESAKPEAPLNKPVSEQIIVRKPMPIPESVVEIQQVLDTQISDTQVAATTVTKSIYEQMPKLLDGITESPRQTSEPDLSVAATLPPNGAAHENITVSPLTYDEKVPVYPTNNAVVAQSTHEVVLVPVETPEEIDQYKTLVEELPHIQEEATSVYVEAITNTVDDPEAITDSEIGEREIAPILLPKTVLLETLNTTLVTRSEYDSSEPANEEKPQAMVALVETLQTLNAETEKAVEPVLISLNELIAEVQELPADAPLEIRAELVVALKATIETLLDELGIAYEEADIIAFLRTITTCPEHILAYAEQQHIDMSRYGMRNAKFSKADELSDAGQEVTYLHKLLGQLAITTTSVLPQAA